MIIFCLFTFWLSFFMHLVYLCLYCLFCLFHPLLTVIVIVFCLFISLEVQSFNTVPVFYLLHNPCVSVLLAQFFLHTFLYINKCISYRHSKSKKKVFDLPLVTDLNPASSFCIFKEKKPASSKTLSLKTPFAFLIEMCTLDVLDVGVSSLALVLGNMLFPNSPFVPAAKLHCYIF